MRTGTGQRVQPLAYLAERTEGFSGSDLNELCSQAATMPVHEALEERERWAGHEPCWGGGGCVGGWPMCMGVGWVFPSGR